MMEENNQVNENRSIPYSREAEMHVLGGILVEPNIANEFCTRLNEDDFYLKENRLIYQAIDYLFRQKEDTTVIKVIEYLKQRGVYGSIGENYLFEITDSVPTVFDVEAYIDVLKDNSLKRELFNATRELSNDILKGKSEVSKILSDAERKIMTISNKQRSDNLKPIAEVLEPIFDLIDANRNRAKDALIGLDTGYQELNEFTFGFQKGELIILAARPAVGKSAFALNIAEKAARNTGAHIAFFSLEMGLDQLSMRLLSICSNVKLSKIRSGDMNEEETTRLLAGRAILNDLNIYLDETTTNNMEDIKVQCRKLSREGKLDFIIVDYLQLMATSKDSKNSEYAEVSALSRSLKLLARELNVPVLALSQLSRAVETRKDDEGKVGNSKPVLSDLRSSGSIEQDADIVLFLHAEKPINEDATKKVTQRKIEVIIAKNRQGMTGSFPLLFRGDYSSFESYKNKDK